MSDVLEIIKGIGVFVVTAFCMFLFVAVVAGIVEEIRFRGK